jgi:hypothetical protein
MSNTKNTKPSNIEPHIFSVTQRAKELGRDLVKISTHKTDCPLCKPWQGKILSITGRTKGYPTLEKARKAGLFHEGCRHAMGLYIDLDKEIEELERELRTPRKQAAQPKGCGCGTIIALLGMIALIIIVVVIIIS